MVLADYRTALVTGASSGIGAAVAAALAARGLTVHVTARRRERLDELGRRNRLRSTRRGRSRPRGHPHHLRR